MRRSISKIPYRSATATATATATPAAFSTSSSGGGGGGGGRGRGRGGPSAFQFTVDTPPPPEDDSKHPNLNGRGRGRGVPVAPSSVPPSFASFLNNESNPAAFGRGRGIGFAAPNSFSPPQPDPNVPVPGFGSDESEAPPGPAQTSSIPSSIFNVLTGAGRGKPGVSPAPQSEKPRAETHQTRAREQSQPSRKDTAREHLTQEEKVKKAVGILSERGGGGPEVRAERWEGGRGGGQGQGRGRGRGRGGGRAMGRGRGGYGGRGSQDDRYEDSEGAENEFLGDPAAEEKVARRLGPEVTSKLTEGFEEMSKRVLPTPMDFAMLDAFETNMMIECEPEYFMEEFGTNPDIDEKPPIPLRDALEKMKPFLMAYEGIQSQEEWEEIIEATMEKVPLIKSVIDHYGGPDRVTAKQQQGELERVAKTLPASAPASVKRFTDRAVLSLQSNPGWGFDKKCQFMDKLVMEVSQHYK